MGGEMLTGVVVRGLLLVLVLGVAGLVRAAQLDIPNPLGSGSFGDTVTVLPNGNFVVVDRNGPVFANTFVGAVHLYSPTGTLISSLTGSAGNHKVGGGGIVVLSNGHFVVLSPEWDNGAVLDVGAVTWVNGTLGLNGTVSASNSLIGSTVGDKVGSSGVAALTNGNYVVASQFWDNGAVIDAGAATWAQGTGATVGVVSATNSLVGSSAQDRVGLSVVALPNNNYVVDSYLWDNGASINVGANTWGNGSTGVVGPVSIANSLIGSTAGDGIGDYGSGFSFSPDGIIVLANGNYLVLSPRWNNGAVVDAGAVTWVNGSSGIAGVVSATNSLVGTSANDRVGSSLDIRPRGVAVLSNGHVVVPSSNWDNGALTDAGAVTWINGSTGLTGAVSTANSLVGNHVDDRIGSVGVTGLSNGNYVVSSPLWDNGVLVDVGAVTWLPGGSGTSDVVEPRNSLRGGSANDRVGFGGVTALSNGNYVVLSNFWSNAGNGQAGAATWANGSSTFNGLVSVANSLVGSAANHNVGKSAVALSNGNYVVHSPGWDSPSFSNAGALTWVNGSSGLIGVVSAANSLIGNSSGESLGNELAVALLNGHYVVRNPAWDNGTLLNVGAVTWVDGAVGLVGVQTVANSLVGSSANDGVGVVTALSDGNYVIGSALWDNGALSNAGAVSLSRNTGVNGFVTPANSVIGMVANSGSSQPFAYDAAREQLVVGRPVENLVTIFTLPGDAVFANGFEP